MSRKSLKGFKKTLFELMISSGESPDNLDGDLSIMSNGIKYTKKRSNGNIIFTVEDTSVYDNYYEINNEFILKSMIETIKNVRPKKIRGTTKLCEPMET